MSYCGKLSGEVQLLGLSVRGQLQAIVLPVVERRDEALSNQPSAQVGRSVGDLLSAIGDVCQRYVQHDSFLIVYIAQQCKMNHNTYLNLSVDLHVVFIAFL